MLKSISTFIYVGGRELDNFIPVGNRCIVCDKPLLILVCDIWEILGKHFNCILE